MPFPDDETIMKTAGALVEGLQGVFGKYPGMRPGKTHEIAARLFRN
jgi:catalase